MLRKLRLVAAGTQRLILFPLLIPNRHSQEILRAWRFGLKLNRDIGASCSSGEFPVATPLEHSSMLHGWWSPAKRRLQFETQRESMTLRMRLYAACMYVAYGEALS
ncbi:hypothetical protein FN846DRAFT_895091 [Sphaerosporella brunnea]|uniref:Uncharacterized protein n=1 Tax=Sphaerosporella brunnea TaxID=1250544 RepID=A0A5J5EGC6_9PEZI|nr:hypothetical protein FN846DRAFT_895091 [Sphaerosporella brunnea]